MGETLDGRGDQLRAKTIAFDVYGYSVAELVGRESVVRVDVGRLRRKLQDYADGPGAEDPLHILLEKGNYTPRFSVTDPATDPADPPPATSPAWRLSPRRVAVLACVGLAAIAGGVGLTRQTTPTGPDRSVNAAAERIAIFKTAPERLSAINLAEDARNLIFPALDPNRLRAALQVFQAAIDTDPSYFGGYAGVAQVQASFAMLLAEPEQRGKALQAAETASQRARNLAPGEAWSESTHAWVAFARRAFGEASRHSARAVALDPDNVHILEFDALIALFTGDFDRVLTETDRLLEEHPQEAGSVFLNAAGSARFHTGDYAGTVALFSRSIVEGGPVGPASLAYLMAAHQQLGNTERAAELAAQFRKNWPESRFETMFGGLFADPAYAEDLISAMRAAGWQPGS